MRYIYIMDTKTKYLSYIEETEKQHKVINSVAKNSGRKAVAQTRSHSIPIVYLNGRNIVLEGDSKNRKIIGKVRRAPRSLKVGTKIKLQKK
jgi:hypothetical protein